jgi:hypothetical protein
VLFSTAETLANSEVDSEIVSWPVPVR